MQNPIGIGPGSNVDVMKRRLKELEAPTYGTKSQLYKRLQQYETKAKLRSSSSKTFVSELNNELKVEIQHQSDHYRHQFSPQL